MRKYITATALAVAALVAGFVPAAAAEGPPAPPVPAECQTYYNSAAAHEVVAAQRLVQISDLERQVSDLSAKVDRKNATIARLRARLHRG